MINNERVISMEAVNSLVEGTTAFFAETKLDNQDAVVTTVPVDEIIEGGGKLIIEAAKKMDVSKTILDAVIEGYHTGGSKFAHSSEYLYKLLNEVKYGKQIAVKTFTIVDEFNECRQSAIQAVPGYKVASTSLLLRDFVKENGYYKKKRNGLLGSTVSIKKGATVIEGGYDQSFGDKVTHPAMNVLSLEFGAMINAHGCESNLVLDRWDDIHERGVLYDGKNLYSNTMMNRRKITNAKLFIVASESPSGLKEGSVLMFHMGTNNYDDAKIKFENRKNYLEDGAVEIMIRGYKEDKAGKYVKRSNSMACANAITLGAIDLTKYKMLVRKEAWVDGHDMLQKVDNLVDMPLDGQAFGRLSFFVDLASKKFKIAVNEFDVLMANEQSRSTAVANKMFLKMRTDELMDEYEASINLDEYAVIGNPDGETVIITDANVTKLLHEYLNSGIQLDQIKLLTMNFSHESGNRVNNSAQTSNKFGAEYRDEFDSFMVRQEETEIITALKEILAGDEGGEMTAFSTPDVLMAKIKGDEAINTTIAQKNFIKRVDDAIKPVAKKGAVKMAGCTVAVSMEEAPVIAPNKFFHLLGCFGGVHEMYCSDLIKNRAELFDKYLNKNGKLMINALKAVIMKYPSQGANEHLQARFLTLEELVLRIAYGYQLLVNKGVMKVSEAARLAKMMVINIKFDGSGTVLMSNVNPDANCLAGFDKDFDKVTVITEKDFVALVDKKIDDNKKTLPDGRVVKLEAVAISDNEDDSLAAYSLI